MPIYSDNFEKNSSFPLLSFPCKTKHEKIILSNLTLCILDSLRIALFGASLPLVPNERLYF